MFVDFFFLFKRTLLWRSADSLAWLYLMHHSCTNLVSLSATASWEALWLITRINFFPRVLTSNWLGYVQVFVKIAFGFIQQDASKVTQKGTCCQAAGIYARGLTEVDDDTVGIPTLMLCYAVPLGNKNVKTIMGERIFTAAWIAQPYKILPCAFCNESHPKA